MPKPTHANIESSAINLGEELATFTILDCNLKAVDVDYSDKRKATDNPPGNKYAHPGAGHFHRLGCPLPLHRPPLVLPTSKVPSGYYHL